MSQSTQTAIFRGAHIRKVEIKPAEGVTLLKIIVQADYSEPLQAAMSFFNWQDLPDAESEGKLIGELAGCKTFEFTPNGTYRAISVSCQIAKNFKLKRIKVGKQGVATTVVIRFEAFSVDLDGGKTFQDMMNVVGDIDGQLVIDYERNVTKKPGQAETHDQQPPLIDVSPEKKKPGRPKKEAVEPPPAQGGVVQ